MENVITKKEKNIIDNLEKYSSIYIALILGIVSIIKLVYISHISGPSVYGDELIYKRGAEEIFYKHSFYPLSYPVGYPFVLSFAFFFKENFYFVMKLINIVLGDIFLVGVYKLTKEFTQKKYALLAMLLCAFLPFLYIYSGKIMSENLYFPLFVWTIYVYVIALKDNTVGKNILLGVMIFLLHVTRHVTIVLLPMFALVWLIEKNDKGKIPLRINLKQIQSGLVIVSSWGVLFGSWLIYCLLRGREFGKIIGLQISGGVGSADVGYITNEALVKIIILYICCLVLEAVFTFSMLFLKQKEEDNVYTKFKWLIAALTFMLLFASIRHSWRAEYNYPEISYVLVRYFIYAVVLLVILAVTSFARRDVSQKKMPLVFIHFVTLALCVLSVVVLITNPMDGVRTHVLSNFNTFDLYFLDEDNFYILLILLLVISGIILLITDVRKYATCMAVSFMCICGIGVYCGMQKNVQSDSGYLGKEVAEYLISQEVGSIDFVVNDTNVQSFAYDVEFFDIRQEGRIDLGWSDKARKMDDYANISYEDVHNILLIEADEEEAQSQILAMEDHKGIVICEVQDWYTEEPLKQIEFADKVWGIYSYPVNCIGVEESVSTNISPNRIIIDEDFSDEQINFAVKVDLPVGEWNVWLNDEDYGKVSLNEEGYGSILIDSEIITSSKDVLEVTVGSKEVYVENSTTITYQVEIIDVTEMKVNMSYPLYLKEGEHFNVQPNGESVMVLEIEGCPAGSQIAVYINDEFVGYGGVGDDMYSTIVVPQKYYVDTQDDMKVQFKYVAPGTRDEYGESEIHIVDILPNTKEY